MNWVESTMRYLQTFNERLKQLRETTGYQHAHIADATGASESHVRAWEARELHQRQYPSLDQLLDLCRHTQTRLDYWLDLSGEADAGQLELPGLADAEAGDLMAPLAQLQQEIARLIPSDEEVELLKRFRRTTQENRKLIIQLLT